MAYKLLLPKFGMAMESAKILEWKKEVGDQVDKEETVLIVENEKLTSDILSMEAGVLLKQVAQIGEKYLVGDLLAYLGEADEAVPEDEGGAAQPVGTGVDAGALSPAAVAGAGTSTGTGAAQGGRVVASPLAKKLATQLGLDIAAIPGSGSGGRVEKADVEQFAEVQKQTQACAAAPGTGASGHTAVGVGADALLDAGSEAAGRVKASPLAKKIAAQLGLDIAAIPGSGPGGRVEKADVEQFAEAQKQTRASAAAATAAPGITTAVATSGTAAPDATTAPGTAMQAATADGAAYDEIPYTGMRQAVGINMTRSWTTVPMVTHHVKADFGAVLDIREAINKDVEDRDSRVSVNDMLLKLTAAALTKLPSVNASLTGDVIRVYRSVHLGVATALDNGLIVPVIRDADKKGLLQISKEAKGLVERARSGRLQPDDVGGGTFTVTNLGGYGSVDEFTPIINPPEAAILGVGRTVDTPVAVDGEIRIRPMLTLSFTYDHRVIDGAVAAQFIRILMDLLLDPMRALL